MGETLEQGDSFGHSLAVGDFNGDHYADLAIGVPFENLEGADTDVDAGVVHVLYGSSAGLSLTGALFLSQDDPQIYGNQKILIFLVSPWQAPISTPTARTTW